MQIFKNINNNYKKFQKNRIIKKAEKLNLFNNIDKRRYEAAKLSNSLFSWATKITTADDILKYDLAKLRARSRELAENNGYYKKFIKTHSINVIGEGIKLQNRAKEDSGSLDKNANTKIETAWKDFSLKGNCDVTSKYSMTDLQRLILETVVRDGEIIIRKVKGFNNKYKYAIQLFEADLLDENYNKELSNGNTIKLGIEFDKWDRPVAYHLRKKNNYNQYQSKNYERIPANEIIHLFLPERPSQSRGIPWGASGMLFLHHLNGYTEAEIIAARLQASQMGFIKSEHGTEFTGDSETDQEITIDVEPGAFRQLPAGMTVDEWKPTHPNGNFENFQKSMLYGTASGLGISYHSLSSDLSSVNYSSIRQGTLEDRDNYKSLQKWFIENFLNLIYTDFLEMGILTGNINLPFSKFEKFNSPDFKARGWFWVDPLKDIKANVEALNNNLKSRSQIVSESGQDFEELAQQLELENIIMNKYNLLKEEEATT